MSFPKNVFSAFGVIFLITAAIVPIQNLIVWGPEMVLDFYISPEITAEKLSIGVIGLGIFFIILAHKKRNSIYEVR